MFARQAAIAEGSRVFRMEVEQDINPRNLREIEKIVAEMGKQQPRRLLNLLLEAVATAENLADSHSILRARYKRDIEIMSENQ